MGGFSPWHLLIIAGVAAVLFFGWKQLPDMARSAGRSLRVFKTEIKGMTEDDSKRDAAREQDDDAAPKQLEPRPQAQVQPVQRAAAPEPQPARSRPRPAPSPHGSSNTPAR